jgi:hypothetical protein
LRLTVGQSVSQSVLVSSPIWGSWPDIYYCLTVTVLSLWGTLSDERTVLSFVFAAGPCQHMLSRVRVPRDSRSYFTLSDMRLPFSSPPTTRRVTVEVFEPASTRVYLFRTILNWLNITTLHGPNRKHHCPTILTFKILYQLTYFLVFSYESHAIRDHMSSIFCILLESVII